MGIDAQWRADITRRLEDMAKVQQDTAIIQVRMVERLDHMERWQNDADDRREKQEDRRDTRDDKRPDQRIAKAAILIAAISAGLTFVSVVFGIILVVASHWK